MDKFVSLICHPDTPAEQIHSISVAITYMAGKWRLAFTVAGKMPFMPEPARPERTDGLWLSTCFELFVKGGDEGYTEFNFAPSTRWAAYRFTGYRQDMSEIELVTPHILAIESGIQVEMEYPVDDSADIRLGLSAIIEELDGTKSCWALAHPPGRPDFHHPDCFALKIGAAGNI